MEYLIGAILGALVVAIRNSIKDGARRERARRYDISDPGNQIRFVQDAQLYPRKPINGEAFKAVFKPVETYLSSKKAGYRLFAEVSMGSFVKTSKYEGTASQRNRAYSSFGGKRVDFLIIDPLGNPALVIEYHGSGHYQGDAERRDAVKRTVLSRAGIALIEVHEDVPASQAVESVARKLGGRHKRTGPW